MRVVYLIVLITCFACKPGSEPKLAEGDNRVLSTPFLVVLGSVQDGGSPHIACKKKCCNELFDKPDVTRKVVSLGLVDPINRQTFLLEATPDIGAQMKLLKHYSPFKDTELPDAIMLTHAHIGHYSGLMYLGREANNAKALTVYAMPRMKQFIENNGPWSQLIALNNISLKNIKNGEAFWLSSNLKVTTFLVPHRDEFSETVGFFIQGPTKKALFIPDIDKWDKWDKEIVEEIKKVDYAFIDATFFDGNEVNNRNIKEIPHPFVIESIQLLNQLDSVDKSKVRFIHFNHTNPLLDSSTKESALVKKSGFNIARMRQVFSL